MSYRAVCNLAAAIWTTLSSYLSWILSLRGLLAKAVLVVVVAAVYIVIPRDGDLVILRRAEVVDPSNESTAIVRRANAIARGRAELAAVLSSRFSQNSEIVSIEESIAPRQISKLVQAALEITLDTEAVDLSYTVNLTALAQAYITRYLSSARAVHVVVDDWREVQSSRRTMTLTLLANSSRNFDDPPLFLPELRREVAAFLTEKIYDARIDCSEILCAKDTPASSDDIRILAEGIDALGSLRNAGICLKIDEERACLAELRRVLEQMADERDGGPTADFLLFLIELSDLKRRISVSGESDQIASSLEAAHGRLLRAKNSSDFFSKLVGDSKRFDAVLTRNGFRELDLKTEFLTSYSDFLEGRRAMQRGDYPQAIASFDLVLPSAPSWFLGYVRAFHTFAVIESDTSDLSLASSVLERFRSNDTTLLAPAIRHVDAAKAWVERAASVSPPIICAVDSLPDYQVLRDQDPDAYAIWIGSLRKRHHPEC